MEHRSELLRLVSGLCDGQLSEEENARLEVLLKDAEARRTYLQYMDMHARLLRRPELSLTTQLAGVDAAMPREATANEKAIDRVNLPRSRVEDRSIGTKQQAWRWLSYLGVAAATLAATVLVQMYAGRETQREAVTTTASVPAIYVATLSQSQAAVWGPSTDAYRPGARVLAGDFQLQSGVARLSYDAGVELIVEGPAHLRLDDASAATLLSGKVFFRADDASPPFTLSTPTSVLVDLGTEYAVSVGATRDEVHVFAGEVQRTAKETSTRSEPELLGAGEARAYGDRALVHVPASADPAKFVREMPTLNTPDSDPKASLLAYEGFDYVDAAALRDETADGGTGFVGPWGGGFARGVGEKQGDRLALHSEHGLFRDAARSAAVGGMFEHAGFAKYFRRLAAPVRLDQDGLFYFSFLVRREGPPLDPLNAVTILLRESNELARDQQDGTTDMRKRLNFGVDRTNELFTHLERMGRRMPLPMSYGETYLLVAKVVASGTHPDQVFLRVYGPQEPVDAQEPAVWSVVGPPTDSSLVFDWLEIHINSHTRQAIDEIRIGTSWPSVAATWYSKPTEN